MRPESKIVAYLIAILACFAFGVWEGTSELPPESEQLVEEELTQDDVAGFGQAIGTGIQVNEITCGPAWLPFASVTCGGTPGVQKAIHCENRNTGTATDHKVYLGGGTNFTTANYTWGAEICNGCASNQSAEFGVAYGAGLKCATNSTDDAGTKIQCTCVY